MTKEEVLKELERISKELNVQIDDAKVLREWNKKYSKKISGEIYDETIRKIFFSPEKCVYGVKYDSNSYKVTAIQKTENDEWENIN